VDIVYKRELDGAENAKWSANRRLKNFATGWRILMWADADSLMRSSSARDAQEIDSGAGDAGD